MRDPKIRPLDPSLATLVRRERLRGRTAAPAKEAAYSAVLAKLGLLQAAAASSGGAAAAAKAGAATAAKASTAVRAWVVVAKLAALACVGGVLAMSVVRVTQHPSPYAPPPLPPPMVAAQRAAPLPIGDAAIEVSPTPTPSAPPAPTSLDRAPITERQRPRVPRGDDGALGEERRLLDDAQRALARHDPNAALGDVGVHARRFPQGQLEAEREAIAIRALVLAGRGAEAGTRARRFRARFPNNLFGPAVDAAVENENGPRQ